MKSRVVCLHVLAVYLTFFLILLGFLANIGHNEPTTVEHQFILTPFLEQNLDQAVAIVGTEYHLYFTSPFAWVFTALAALSVYSTMRQRKKANMKRRASLSSTAEKTA